MNAIVSFFLKVRHWQLFVFLAVMSTIAEMMGVVSLPVTARSLKDLGPANFAALSVLTFYMFCFLFWLWSLGTFLNSILHSPLKLSKTFFRFALIYPAAYAPFFMGAFFNSKIALLAIILPLHVFAIFCLIYDLRFVSKTLALVETGRPASFYDYAGPFFLMWFYPVGMWIIQPRINRLYAASNTPQRLTPASQV
jgi:hypothetical protein